MLFTFSSHSSAQLFFFPAVDPLLNFFFSFFFGYKNLICSFALFILLLGFYFFSLFLPTSPTVRLSLSFAIGGAAYPLKTVNTLSCQFCIIRENCSIFLCSYLTTLGSVIHLFSLGKKNNLDI